MKLLAAALSAQALLSACALAHPSSPLRPAPRTDFNARGLHNSTASNWAGTVLTAPPGTFASATATFTVPHPSLPRNATGEHGASGWAGIDGFACAAYLSAGIDFIVPAPNATSFYAFYQWYPQFPINVQEVPVHAGDVVRVSVHAASASAGTAHIENLSTGVSAVKDVASALDAAGAPMQPLCRSSAEWVVGSWELLDKIVVPLADWGEVRFANASAVRGDGTVMGPAHEGAQTVDFVAGGKVVSKVTATESTVLVEYAG
ncbi:acid proteinase [Phanerochaete sordida]|uniref:Acid proteinase n=1 Tax=Phanerochaete sordida TaxID=48140 RepID=A0A9P3G817_9APHY|nr:acid proteinase [Phanerochaete sordida]